MLSPSMKSNSAWRPSFPTRSLLVIVSGTTCLVCYHPPSLRLSFFFSSVCCTNPLLVLGLPHPAVNTRDVALYRPFRTTLRSSNIVGLQTLMWHFMNRQVQKERVVPVSCCIPPSNLLAVGTNFL